MVYLVPLQFDITESGETPLEEEPRPRIIRTSSGVIRTAFLTRPRTRGRTLATDWFIKKTIENEFNYIDATLISGEVIPVITQKYYGIKDIDLKIYENIMSRSDIMIDLPSLYLKDEVMAFTGSEQGSLFLISRIKEGIFDYINKILSNAKAISDISSDLGVTFNNLYYGDEYVKYRLAVSAEILNIDTYKNEFEKKICENIKDSITNSVLTNFTLNFPRSNETYEYDMVVCIGKDTFQISCKDYTQIKEDIHESNTNLRNKVIFSPKDKADLISAKPIVVLSGFQKNLLNQYKAFGQPRGVTILDENECFEAITDLFITAIIEQIPY